MTREEQVSKSIDLSTQKIDYIEQDIYEYFGADQDIYKATRHDLLGVLGGMSGILELLWHKEVTPEIAFKDFKSWLKERNEHNDLLDITEKIPDTNIPIKKREESHV